MYLDKPLNFLIQAGGSQPSYFFQDTYKQLINPVDTYVVNTTANIMSALSPWVSSLMIIYVSFWGIKLLMGQVQGSLFMDGVRRILKMVIIAGFAMSTAIYNDFILDVLWKTPDEIAAIVGTSAAKTPLASIAELDRAMDKFWDIGESLFTKGSITSKNGLGLISVAFVVWISGLIICGLSFLSFILAKISLAGLMAVGCISIALSMFEPTKQWLDGWLKMVATSIYIFIFTTIFVGLVLATTEKFADALLKGGDIGLRSGFMMLTFAGAAILYYGTMAAKASTLAGGFASGVSGAASFAFNKATGAAKSVGGGAKNLATGKTLSDMRENRRRQAANKAWAEKNPGWASKGTSWALNKMRKNSVQKTG